MNRRHFFTAAASAISGIALASCAPKRFPWPGVTEFDGAWRQFPDWPPRPWTSAEIDVLSSQCIQPQASLTPMLDAILQTGQRMDEDNLPAEGRVLLLPQRAIDVVNSELNFDHPILTSTTEVGASAGWIDRFKVFRVGDQFSPYAWQHQPGAGVPQTSISRLLQSRYWTRGYDVVT